MSKIVHLSLKLDIETTHWNRIWKISLCSLYKSKVRQHPWSWVARHLVGIFLYYLECGTFIDILHPRDSKGCG